MNRITHVSLAFLMFCVMIYSQALAQSSTGKTAEDVAKSYQILEQQIVSTFGDADMDFFAGEVVAGIPYPLGNCGGIDEYFGQEIREIDQRTALIVELALNAVYLESVLQPFDVPSLWAGAVESYVQKELEKIALSGEGEVVSDPPSHKIAKVLNEAKIEKFGVVLKFQGDPEGCGAGERGFILQSSPPGAEVSYMNRIWANLCAEQGIDYRSNDCDYWFSVDQGRALGQFADPNAVGMSGRYKIRIRWQEGAVTFKNFDSDAVESETADVFRITFK